MKDSDRPAGTFFLGRYRVVDEIGIGGMASVHLARMDGPGGFQKWVAIKRIHPHLVEDDQFVDMFLDEARIAAGINHANVAQVFDLGKDDNTYWIAMEYLHGEPLREVMRRAEERNVRIQPQLATRICSDAAEGLHAAHELRGKNGTLLGLVHRDVTPHNLFITYDGYTKVVDFGIAKVADRLSSTRAGTLKGKLAYMSPEQVRGAEVDRTTDIFALGVVLWELTTGHRLFRMDTDLDTLEKVQACVVPPPSTLVPDYPIELESVVMKALAKRKQDRFESGRQFSRALQSYLMRAGSFVGPEEVSEFIRDVFSDRIQKREAHLAWAAEVTSTINVDQLRSLQPSISDDPSMGSFDEQSRDGSLPPVPTRPPMSTPGPSARPLSGAPPPRPPPMSAPMPASAQMAATSLMDDDEDVPTTVATREQVESRSSLPLPRPAAGMPPLPPRPAAGAPPTASSGPPLRFGGVGSAPLPPPAPQPSSQPTGRPGEHTSAFPSGGAFGVDPGAPPKPLASIGNANLGPAMGGAPIKFGAPPSNQVPSSPMSYGQPMNAQPGGGANGQMYGQGQTTPSPHSPQPFGMGSAPMNPMSGAHLGAAVHGSSAPAQPQSQVETALSLPRPDPAALWLAQQEVVATQQPKRNTGVLIAVGLLTALCVVGIGALIYFKYRYAQPAVSAEVPTLAAPEPEVTEPETTPPAEPDPPAAPAASAEVAEAAPEEETPEEPEKTPPAEVAATTPVKTDSGSNRPKPTATAEEPGLLTIVCSPVCDDVLDGGRSLGPSPIVQVPVSPGSHVITLKRAGMKPKSVSVSVKSGEVTAQRIVMK